MNIADFIRNDVVLSAFDFETVYRVMLRLRNLGYIKEKE